VIRGHNPPTAYSNIPSLSSILTVRASPIEQRHPLAPSRPLPAEPAPESVSHRSAISVASFYTASEEASIAAATEGGSQLPVHRFTLIKPGTTAKRFTAGGAEAQASSTQGWSALHFFFASGLLPGGAKCDICSKRLGRKAVLECDDCGLRAHLKCGEVAPRDCAIRWNSRAFGHGRVVSAKLSKKT
jgi:LIM domain kinase 1